MNHFDMRDGVLHAEGVAVPTLAEAVGTPFYCYSSATLRRHYQVFAEASVGRDLLIAYSVKANSNQAIIASLAALGAGADVVSEGELRRALAAGVPAERIVFSGVGKTKVEMAAALNAGVLMFNVESEPELEALSEVAAARDQVAPVALRVNPDVDAGTHDKIATGRKGDKFGIPIADAPRLYARAAALPGIAVVGVDVHIGSQLTDLAPFRRAFEHIGTLVAALRAEGHDIRIVDLGGGLGIPYRDEKAPRPEAYTQLVLETIGPLECKIVLEPGRLLVGNAGVLIARVIYVKVGADRTFVILDAAMNDLWRPAMYDAWHDIEAVVAPEADAPLAPVDLVGPVCESADRFAEARMMPPLAAGDLVAIRSAGAYGAVMASSYNSRLLAPELLVSGDRFAIVCPRSDYDSLIARDHVPDWATEEA